jgi:hypothetical protein
MQVVVLDWNFKFMETFFGMYKNGVLVHKTGERKFAIPLTGIMLFKTGGTVEEMEFDYHKTIDVGKQRLALYQWDGKNLHQLSFHDVPESSTLVDFKNEWERARMAEAIALKPPPGGKLETVAKILFSIAVLVAALAILYSVNNLSGTINNQMKNTPIYNISAQVQKEQVYSIKQLNITQSEVTALDAYLYNMSRYLYAKSIT